MVLNSAEPMLKRLKTVTLIRHFRHVKKRAKAKKALTRLRTIANKLIRELQRKLPTHSLFETYQKDFLFYQQVLAQQPKDKNKIYSLHEPDVKAKTTSNMNTAIKSLLSLPKTITLLLAWSVMIKTSMILKP